MTPDLRAELGKLRVNCLLAAGHPDPELRAAFWDLVDELEATRHLRDPRFPSETLGPSAESDRGRVGFRPAGPRPASSLELE